MIAGAPIIGVGIGVPVKLLRHDKKTYRVISVPKSAVPEAVLKVRDVVIVLGVPQQGATIAVEAKLWVEKARHVYYITRKPYSDYLTRLAEQGTRELIMYQIAPTTPRGGRV